MINLAPPVRRVVDYTRLGGFVVLLLLFAGFIVIDVLLSWRFVHSARDIASLFNTPVIVLAFALGLALGSMMWGNRE